MFHPTRRWRFDFSWPEEKLALEVEGALWVPRSGHRTATGVMRDIEKGNAAILLGWRVLRATTEMVKNGEALKLVETMLRKLNEGKF